MRTPDADERGHVTLDVVDPKEVLASLRSADVATTLRLPVLAEAGDDDVTIRGRRDAIDVGPSAPRLPQLERTALDAALEAAARAAKLEELEDPRRRSADVASRPTGRRAATEGSEGSRVGAPRGFMPRGGGAGDSPSMEDDDSPTIRGERPKLELFPDELPTVPAAAMVREALLAATKVALADGEPAPYAFEEDEEDRTLRADRRALAIAMQGDRAVPEASSERVASAPAAKPRLVPEPVQPPALPVPLVRRVDAWIDELPEAARRVLLDARDAQPSWPLVERTEGAVLRPKQRIPSLRPRT
jgi:hypothetical protein